MSTSVVVLQIDDSSDKTIVGAHQWDRDNGGRLVAPAGTAFPTAGVLPGEIFFRTDLQQLFRRNDGDTAWVLFADGTATAAPVDSVNGQTGAVVLNFSDVGAPPDTRNLIAGAGLTGGGDLTADRTFNVVANADGSIVVNANDIQVGTVSDAQHGNRGGGTLHAVATPSVAGFMSAADKTKLDALFDYSDYIENEGTVTETGGAFVTATTLAFTAPAAGTYRIHWSFEARNLTLNAVTRTRVQLDGVDQAFADVALTTNVTAEFPVSGYREVALTAGAHTLTLDHFPFSGAGSQLRRRRLRVERIA